MAHYLLEASYTPDARAAFVRNPGNGMPAIRSLIEKLGGRLVAFYFALGEYDVVAIYEADGDVTAVANALAASAPGNLATVRTTKLVTTDEFMEAIRRARGVL